MKREETPEQKKTRLRLQRARQAEADRILANPLVKEALAKIESRADLLWKDSDAQDNDQRERAYYMYRALKEFEHHFKSIARTGQQAGKDLAEMQKAERRAKPKAKR